MIINAISMLNVLSLTEIVQSKIPLLQNIVYISSAVIEILCWNLNCTKIRVIISNNTRQCYQWVEVLSSTAIVHSKISLLQN